MNCPENRTPETTMNHSEFIQDLLPNDLSVKIASSLQVLELCALGSCSKFWRKLCGSDCVWAGLCRERWPALGLDKKSDAPHLGNHQQKQLEQENLDSDLKGWRGFYIIKHNEMSEKAAVVVDYVEQCLASESIEVGHYLTAIKEMCSMHFEFKDVELFFLKPNLHVLLNLVGLHYCIAWLHLPAEHVFEALRNCNISERQVCVRWWKLGRWSYGFRLRDESVSRRVYLRDIAMAKEDEVLGVLHRGAIHEVLRVQISSVQPVSAHWSCQLLQV